MPMLSKEIENALKETAVSLNVFSSLLSCIIVVLNDLSKLHHCHSGETQE